MTATDPFRRMIEKIPTSVVVAGTLLDGMPVGIVLETFTPVSSAPPLVGLFGDPRSETLRTMLTCSRWSFCLLGHDHLPALRDARGAAAALFESMGWAASAAGTPHLRTALLTIDATPRPVGSSASHQAILAEVMHVHLGDPAARPLVLQGGRVARLDPGEVFDRWLTQLGTDE